MKTFTKLASLMMVSAGLVAAPIASAHPAPHAPKPAAHHNHHPVAPKKVMKKQAKRAHFEKHAPRHH